MTVHLDAEIEIPHPAEAVWEVVADYGLDPQWRRGVETMAPSPAGAVRVGTTTAEVMRFAGRTLHNDGEVVALQPGRRFAWRTTSGARAWGARSVEPLDPGRCRVRLELDVEPRPSERLMVPLTRRLLRRKLNTEVHDLAGLVAARADASEREATGRRHPTPR